MSMKTMILFAALLMIGCAPGSGSGSAATSPTQVIFPFKTMSEVPACAPKYQNYLIIVEQEQAMFYCRDGIWTHE